MLRFDKIGCSLDLEPERHYHLPEKEVTHIGLKNGKIAFFWSPEEIRIHKSGRNWLFVRIPEGAKAFAFPKARRDESGWSYGIFSPDGRIDI